MNGKAFDGVTFRAGRSIGQMYLLLADASGRRIALSAMQEAPAGWKLTLPLPPGKYRYRYYATCDGVTVYCPPSESDDFVDMDGLDGVRRVTARNDEGESDVSWDLLQSAVPNFA